MLRSIMTSGRGRLWIKIALLLPIISTAWVPAPARAELSYECAQLLSASLRDYAQAEVVAAAEEGMDREAKILYAIAGVPISGFVGVMSAAGVEVARALQGMEPLVYGPELVSLYAAVGVLGGSLFVLTTERRARDHDGRIANAKALASAINAVTANSSGRLDSSWQLWRLHRRLIKSIKADIKLSKPRLVDITQVQSNLGDVSRFSEADLAIIKRLSLLELREALLAWTQAVIEGGASYPMDTRGPMIDLGFFTLKLIFEGRDYSAELP